MLRRETFWGGVRSLYEHPEPLVLFVQLSCDEVDKEDEGKQVAFSRQCYSVAAASRCRLEN